MVAKRIPVIKTDQVVKHFKLTDQNIVKAIRGVDSEIYPGEYIILFGPSGCGKSTFMSLIAGLERPTSGEIYIRGEAMGEKDDDELALHRRRKIGVVFQARNLVRSMNVVENVALPLAFAGIPKRMRMKRAKNLLEEFGLGHVLNHAPVELSGGQEQRVAIARALSANPWIIVADEPTAALHSRAADEVMELLVRINRVSKRTIILTTHNPEYRRFAHRVFYMKDGQLVKIKINSAVKEFKGLMRGRRTATIHVKKQEEDEKNKKKKTRKKKTTMKKSKFKKSA